MSFFAGENPRCITRKPCRVPHIGKFGVLYNTLVFRNWCKLNWLSPEGWSSFWKLSRVFLSFRRRNTSGNLFMNRILRTITDCKVYTCCSSTWLLFRIDTMVVLSGYRNRTVWEWSYVQPSFPFLFFNFSPSSKASHKLGFYFRFQTLHSLAPRRWWRYVIADEIWKRSDPSWIDFRTGKFNNILLGIVFLVSLWCLAFSRQNLQYHSDTLSLHGFHFEMKAVHEDDGRYLFYMQVTTVI